MGFWELPCIEVDRTVIKLEVFSGEIAAVKTWSETHVTSSGGGGMIVQGTGYVSQARVTSNITRHDELYIRDDDGNERHLHLTNVDLGVRDGSRVSAVLGLMNGKQHGWWVGIYNHDTRVWTPFKNGLSRLAPSPAVGVPLLLGAAAALCFTVDWLAYVGVAALLAAGTWYVVQNNRAQAAVQSQFRVALAKLCA